MYYAAEPKDTTLQPPAPRAVKGIGFIEAETMRIARIWLNRTKDRGMMRMVAEVMANEDLARAIEDWDQVYANLNWEAMYAALASSARYQQLVLQPTPLCPRDKAYQQLAAYRTNIANLLEGAFRNAIMLRLQADIDQLDEIDGRAS